MLRHQTTDQRSKREQLKENRKALLNAQLTKVRQRKMKTKLDGTQDDQGAGPKQEEDEAHEEAPAVKKLEVEIQERRDTKSGVPHVREWDRGKVDFFGKWTSRRQDDRESEFTPPSVYFSDDKRQGYGKWAKREQDKPKMAFMWSEGQGGGHSYPRPSPKVVLYPSPSQVPLYPLNPQCYSLTTAQRSTP
ncbi:coiled-coil domain-containing protein 174 [Oncorhynchus mykiss]|uniref:coiled-coil domain-containing protein 174 n=1 Tax=Oncorhynchus mykiss TaxID=8022 RepID=UPI001878A443|nr:coiled-coil domain-containing protein 174 [Oncorhynchus mykiss]XP_036806281.1 coiled-coil domain-containing protein 174 [Oncorhynchus mykiss]XP_036806282.1 coiled-coil domain-containing protein 174 [Oncorhynchus mykiss]XP_036806283.1 coiled-coil domain-containing protein 174 [Oncorhynchus mykiss]XP_036806284.1 coiled-coil domain-containing protein 174 [Oncorhynchus mykiss]XP_036806285.1 coiled-coil domain-containing protein 174 [Oncorhynchus mykiss]